MNNAIRELIIEMIKPTIEGYTEKINDVFENINGMKIWIRQIKNTIDFIDGNKKEISKIRELEIQFNLKSDNNE